MAQQQLPDAWRKAVCAILKTGRTGKEIEWTHDATTRYQGDFVAAFQNDLYPILHNYFQGPPNATGCPISMAKPAGETWEFLFVFKGSVTYGKVLLYKDKRKIVIFSAHLPLKSKLSCD